MRGITISVGFHLALAVAIVVGLPLFEKSPSRSALPIPVDVVRLSDITNPPKGDKPVPKPKKTPDADKSTTKDDVSRGAKKAKKITPKRSDKAEIKAKPVEKKEIVKEQPSTKAETKEVKKTIPKKAEIKKVVPKPVAPKKPVLKAETKAKPKPKTTPAPKVTTTPVSPKKVARKTEKPSPKKQMAALSPEKKKTEPAKKEEAKTTDSEKPAKVTNRPRLRPKWPKKNTLEAERKVAKKSAKKPDEKKKKNDRKPRKSETARRKTKRDDDPLSSVLDSVRKMKRTERRSSDRDRTAKRRKPGAKTTNSSLPVTVSEIDAVRRQIQPCWNFPAGAKNAASLRVLIRLHLRRDGRLSKAEVLDKERMLSDAHFRAAAEAALRAVNNPRCGPLRLPAAKYELWKNLVIDFDPSKLSSG